MQASEIKQCEFHDLLKRAFGNRTMVIGCDGEGLRNFIPQDVPKTDKKA